VQGLAGNLHHSVNLSWVNDQVFSTSGQARDIKLQIDYLQEKSACYAAARPVDCWKKISRRCSKSLHAFRLGSLGDDRAAEKRIFPDHENRQHLLLDCVLTHEDLSSGH
jgi:hypothetical protein